MFQERINFFRPMMLCVCLISCLYVAQMIWNLFDMVDWGAEGRDQKPGVVFVKPEKAQRRRNRAYLLGFLMVTFVKVVMNPYPTLHDFSTLSFVALMNITFMSHYVEAFLFLVFGILYGFINTWLLAITWLHRFSGNANFLFFQIVALDALTVIMFLQVFMGADAKRKKYAKELLRKQDRKKPKTASLEAGGKKDGQGAPAGKTAQEILDEPIETSD
mmetsp:Transcript_9661/g.13180  ORF Transcript_9661/g.13180 Transcript_9661/m.13180 type:complete len:217 (+) Transcript_9661:830-1480(+)